MSIKVKSLLHRDLPMVEVQHAAEQETASIRLAKNNDLSHETCS